MCSLRSREESNAGANMNTSLGLIKVLRFAAIVIGTVVGFSNTAYADSIGPDCTNCFGGTYTLEYEVIGADEYLITLTADLTGTSNDGITLDNVAFKIADGSGSLTYESVQLLDSPDGWGDDAVLSKGLQADCSPTLGSWICSQSDTNINADDLLIWTFDVTLDGNAELLLPPDLSSLKIDFNGCNESGQNGCLLSENIQLQQNVPEGGSTITLLGSALVAFGLMARKFRNV